MSAIQISDAQIAAMSVEDRRELIMRLAQTGSTIISLPRARRMRRRRLALTIAAPVALLPWVVYLGVMLPDHYVARHWAAAWVGFDVLLMAMLWGAVHTQRTPLVEAQVWVSHEPLTNDAQATNTGNALIEQAPCANMRAE
jgi:hypothetical protein